MGAGERFVPPLLLCRLTPPGICSNIVTGAARGSRVSARGAGAGSIYDTSPGNAPVTAPAPRPQRPQRPSSLLPTTNTRCLTTLCRHFLLQHCSSYSRSIVIFFLIICFEIVSYEILKFYNQISLKNSHTLTSGMYVKIALVKIIISHT